MSSIGKNKLNRTKRLRIALLVLIDLGTKYRIFAQNIQNGLINPLINQGAARSLSIDVSLLVLVSIVAISGLVYLYHRKSISTSAFILIMAGALGNIYDRIVYNGVRDWISIGNFPVFNIADILLTIGVVIIALHYYRESRKQRVQ